MLQSANSIKYGKARSRSGLEMQREMETRGPNDPVAMYLREAASVEPRTAAEEAELFRRLGTTNDWQGETENAARLSIHYCWEIAITFITPRRFALQMVHM